MVSRACKAQPLRDGPATEAHELLLPGGSLNMADC